MYAINLLCVDPYATGFRREYSFDLSDPFVHAGDPPETVKMRLKQWAQVVALSMLSRH